MTSANRIELMKQQLDTTLQSFEEPAPERAAPAPDLLSTATRVVVGPLLLAADALSLRAPAWEQLAQGEAAISPTPDGAQDQPAAQEPVAERRPCARG
ncbi:MAG: hypothetical protein HGA45_34670 [Chloroflexales bacterium]|nr:hypothetical protein [Chloroflexales bacterium]